MLRQHDSKHNSTSFTADSHFHSQLQLHVSITVVLGNDSHTGLYSLAAISPRLRFHMPEVERIHHFPSCSDPIPLSKAPKVPALGPNMGTRLILRVCKGYTARTIDEAICEARNIKDFSYGD